MTRRSPLVRFFTLAWASLQLAAPALTSIADGRLASDSAGAKNHIEASSTERCPQVHSPDCGLCRYVTMSTVDDAAAPALNWATDVAVALPRTDSQHASSATVALPFSRAPPAL